MGILTTSPVGPVYWHCQHYFLAWKASGPMSRRVALYVREERTPGLTAWLMVAACVVALVVMLWRWILLGVAIYVVGRYLWQRHKATVDEHARLCAQADKEHRAVLRGDPYGVYGQYSHM